MLPNNHPKELQEQNKILTEKFKKRIIANKIRIEKLEKHPVKNQKISYRSSKSNR